MEQEGKEKKNKQPFSSERAEEIGEGRKNIEGMDGQSRERGRC